MIWVTGNKGMLGSKISSILKSKNMEYVSSDREVDITDITAINEFVQSKEISWIVNCAAYTNVDGAESNIDEAFNINSLGVKNLITTAKEIGAVLIHFSTDFVFDGLKAVYTETDVPNPLNVYGNSKLAGEFQLIQSDYRNWFVIRTAWLFGDGGLNFVDKILENCRIKKEFSVVDDQFGSPTYTQDLGNFILDIIISNNKNYGIYNYTNSGGPISRYEFAKEIFTLAKEYRMLTDYVEISVSKTSDFKIIAKRPVSSFLSLEKIKKYLNTIPKNWKQSLESYIKDIQ